MSEWIKAEEMPRGLEGLRAWMWSPREPRVELSWIPRGYSRDKKDCAGVWFWPLITPAPPEFQKPEQE